MDKRIKLLRKSEGLNQEDFAKQIKVSRGAVANYEIGRNIPTDAVIENICRAFNVSEEWLRHGTGEMKNSEPEDDISRILERFGLGAEFRDPLTQISRLGEDEQEYILNAVQTFLEYRRKTRSAERRAELHAELERQINVEEKGEDASPASSSGN